MAPPSVRRSSRSRKKVGSFYEDAKNEGSKKKPRIDDEDESKHVSSDDGSMSPDEELINEDSSSEEEESDDEAPPPPSSRKRKSPSKPPARKKKDLPEDLAEAKSPRKGRGASAAKGLDPTRKQATTALSALAKKLGDSDDDVSLLVSLLLSFQKDGKKRRGTEESFYTTGLKLIAQQLLDDHKDDSNAAQVELFNLILRCVGGTSMLKDDTNLEEMSDEAWGEEVSGLLEEMQDSDCAVLTADTGSKVSIGVSEFRKIYSEFWYQLTTTALLEGEKSARFQVEWIRDVVSRLVELAGVSVPDLRLALSIGIYKIGHAVLDKTVELRHKVQTADRQLTVAKRSKSTEKAGALKQQIDLWKRTIDDLEDLVSKTVMAIFAKRFKDSHESIRVLSLDSLAAYCRSRPDLFVNNTHLKYTGWMLCDENSAVRLAAIQGLTTAFHSASQKSALKSIIDRYLSRLADCTLDVDLVVQEKAMELLLLLMREDFFDEIDQDHNIWEQINNRALEQNASPALRRGALYFVIGQLESFDEGAFKSEREAAEQINDISQWLAHTIQDNGNPVEDLQYGLTDLIVASLRDMPEHKPLVCNWAAMLRTLRADERRKTDDQRADTVKQRVVLRMLTTAAREELGDVMLSRVADPQILSAQQAEQESRKTKKKAKNDSQSHEDLTLSLLRALPNLLESFKGEASVLQNLTTLPQYFLPRVLSISTRKKELQAVLDNLAAISLESTDEATLNNCCLSLVALAKGDHSRKDDALLTVKKIAMGLHTRLTEAFQEKAKASDANCDPDVEEGETADLDSAISVCLRRLRVLTKRWPLIDLIADQKEKDEELDSIGKSVFDYLHKELTDRRITRVSSEDDSGLPQVEIPKTWSTDDESGHQAVAESVSEGLQFLLALTSWRLRDETQRIKAGSVDYQEKELKDHVVLRMRTRMTNVILLCFDHFLGDIDEHNFSDAQLEFSVAVQEHAWSCCGDLRGLFPHSWANAKSPFLVACAFSEDTAAIGAGVRFLRSQENRIRDTKDDPDAQRKHLQALLFPVARGLCTNWKTGNRREAGVALVHVSGSGHLAHELVQNISRVMKKIDSVRLLEAHMAALRLEYETWLDSEPEDPGDRPTEAELAEFEEQDKAYQAKFESIQTLAARLSASLGVGKIRDKVLVGGLSGFIHEGIRYAFSTSCLSPQDELPLGGRLTFLIILTKYVNWIRNNGDVMGKVAQDLNTRERELRAHADYAEMHPDDAAALDDFRKICELGDFVDDTETRSATTSRFDTSTRGTRSAFSARTSMGSSVSSIHSQSSNVSGQLQSIREESPGADDESPVQDGEETETSPPSKRRNHDSQSSPVHDGEETETSPPSKRRSLLDSQSGTPGSVSTLGNSRVFSKGSDDDDSSTSTTTTT